eukprot:gene5958-9147_t
MEIEEMRYAQEEGHETEALLKSQVVDLQDLIEHLRDEQAASWNEEALRNEESLNRLQASLEETQRRAQQQVAEALLDSEHTQEGLRVTQHEVAKTAAALQANLVEAERERDEALRALENERRSSQQAPALLLQVDEASQRRVLEEAEWELRLSVVTDEFNSTLQTVTDGFKAKQLRSQLRQEAILHSAPSARSRTGDDSAALPASQSETADPNVGSTAHGAAFDARALPASQSETADPKVGLPAYHSAAISPRAGYAAALPPAPEVTMVDPNAELTVYHLAAMNARASSAAALHASHAAVIDTDAELAASHLAALDARANLRASQAAAIEAAALPTYHLHRDAPGASLAELARRSSPPLSAAALPTYHHLHRDAPGASLAELARRGSPPLSAAAPAVRSTVQSLAYSRNLTCPPALPAMSPVEPVARAICLDPAATPLHPEPEARPHPRRPCSCGICSAGVAQCAASSRIVSPKRCLNMGIMSPGPLPHLALASRDPIPTPLTAPPSDLRVKGGPHDVPSELMVRAPVFSATPARFVLAAKESPLRGLPVWAFGERRLFAGSGGRWLLGAGPRSVSKNRGCLRSSAPHGNVLPHRVAAWESADGKGGWASASVVVEPMGPWLATLSWAPAAAQSAS